MLGTTSWLLWTAPLVAPSALTSPPVMAPEAPIQRELAGRALDEYPWFAHNLAFNQGTPVRLAIDTRRFPELANQTFDVYVVAHRDEWMCRSPSMWKQFTLSALLR